MSADAHQETPSQVGSNAHSRHASQHSSASSSVTEPNLVAVLKDGQTHWIPEHVVAQYLGGQSQQRPPSPSQFSVPRRSSLRRGRRPGMRIAIPSNQFTLPPESVSNAVPLPRRTSRPVHPLERRASYEDHTPPALDSDHSSAQTPDTHDVRSPDSQYDSGTSRSSSEVQTPHDGSPISPLDSKYFYNMDPTAHGVFDDENRVTPRKEAASGEIIQPVALPRHPPRGPTPSLNEAAADLERSLHPAHQSPTSPRAPAIPARSSRRVNLEQQSYTGVAPSNPYSDAVSLNEMSLALSSPPQAADASSPDASSPKSSPEPISNDAADAVIFAILSAIDDPSDLFNTALINKGFYGVYKRHELDLVKEAFRRRGSPPAAAERCEVGPVDSASDVRGSRRSDDSGRTERYKKHLDSDAHVLTALKSLILDQCRSLLHPSTVLGLRGAYPNCSATVDTAFRRLWRFCRRFRTTRSHNKTHRPFDFARQIAWLQQPSKTRPHGLTVADLDDLTELWRCMHSLLSGIVTQGGSEFRVAQARVHGVFIGQGVQPGDCASENHVLEEWVHYLLSLGPRVVLELAEAASDSSDRVFRIARSYGWTQWPASTAHREFFTRAVASVRERLVRPSWPMVGDEQARAQQRHRSRSQPPATFLAEDSGDEGAHEHEHDAITAPSTATAVAPPDTSSAPPDRAAERGPSHQRSSTQPPPSNRKKLSKRSSTLPPATQHPEKNPNNKSKRHSLAPKISLRHLHPSARPKSVALRARASSPHLGRSDSVNHRSDEKKSAPPLSRRLSFKPTHRPKAKSEDIKATPPPPPPPLPQVPPKDPAPIDDKFVPLVKGLTPAERSAFLHLVQKTGWDARKARKGVLRLREVGGAGEVGVEVVERVVGLVG